MKTALVTGAARRIGEAIARRLHGEGYNVVIHYRTSQAAARTLTRDLQNQRPDSAVSLYADIARSTDTANLIEHAYSAWGRLDAVINNASSFYPTPVGTIDDSHWNDLIGSNLKGPLFICQAGAPHLRATGGSIVNLADIYARRPLAKHLVYCAAKAGLLMLTRALAQELGPDIRVNAVAPGAVLWPDDETVTDEQRARIVQSTALGRQGTAEDVAAAVHFLLSDEARYVTGQILDVDGGRGLGGC